jgi:hypothetical protein
MTNLFETVVVDKGAPVGHPIAGGEDTSVGGLEAFVQLFANVTTNRKDRDGTAERVFPHAVGISTDQRHQDGDPREDGQSEAGEPATASQSGEGSGDRGPGGGDTDRNPLTAVAPGDLGATADRRVYVDCDAAGLPQREIKRLARVLQNSAVAGRRAVSVSIQLPELGEMRFDVRIENKTVFIHAFVKSDRAASALALGISTLRDKLAECDLVLGRLDVTTERDSERSAAQDRKERGPRRRNEKERPPWGRANEPFLDNENGRIHVLA